MIPPNSSEFLPNSNPREFVRMRTRNPRMWMGEEPIVRMSLSHCSQWQHSAPLACTTTLHGDSIFVNTIEGGTTFVLNSVLKYSTRRLSKSSPPKCVSPAVALTSKIPPSIDSNETSKVPPPYEVWEHGLGRGTATQSRVWARRYSNRSATADHCRCDRAAASVGRSSPGSLAAAAAAAAARASGGTGPPGSLAAATAARTRAGL